MKIFSLSRKKRLLPLFLSFFLLIGLLNGCNKNQSFDEFTHTLFLEEITANTLNLHYSIENPKEYGIRDYEISLGDFSREARSNAKASLLDTKEQLLEFPYLSLSKEERLTYDILADYLDTQISLCDYPLYQEPLSYSGGSQMNLPILLAEYEFQKEQDVKDYLSLLELVDDHFCQIMDFEKEKSEAGLFMSDEQCEAVIDSCAAFLSNKNCHYLATTFESRLSKLKLSDKKKSSYIKKNQNLLETRVFPAYELMISRLEELLGTGKNQGGLCHFPSGKEYYELLVYSETGCKDSIDDIFNRITSQRMSDLILCADLQGQDSSIMDKCDNLDWDMADPLQMLNMLQENILSVFPAPPETDFKINYVEESLSPYLAPAFYIVAPIDNYKENVIYLNEPLMNSNISCFTTLAHEGFPGHLYQTVMTYEYGFPEIRSILNYSGFVEGWATYIEMMSYYFAGLEEEVASMLSHNQSATLSLYASSDIGLHYYGWDSQDMHQFWKSYGITNESVIDEITQLILSEPGNYLKYYVGYLEFLELQHFAKASLTDDFHLVDFHQTLLDIGPAPFAIIEKYFLDYYFCVQTESTSD